MELKKPYYAVIFTSLRTEGDQGYAQMAQEMEDLARITVLMPASLCPVREQYCRDKYTVPGITPYFSSSISPGLQLLSNQGSRGP